MHCRNLQGLFVLCLSVLYLFIFICLFVLCFLFISFFCLFVFIHLFNFHFNGFATNFLCLLTTKGYFFRNISIIAIFYCFCIFALTFILPILFYLSSCYAITKNAINTLFVSNMCYFYTFQLICIFFMFLFFILFLIFLN